MRLAAVRYAVQEYKKLEKELAPILEMMGPRALVCVVRQAEQREDQNWICEEIRLEEDAEALLAVFRETRRAQKGPVEKKIHAVLDIASIASIEFEVFDEEPAEEDQEKP